MSEDDEIPDDAQAMYERWKQMIERRSRVRTLHDDKMTALVNRITHDRDNYKAAFEERQRWYEAYAISRDALIAENKRLVDNIAALRKQINESVCPDCEDGKVGVRQPGRDEWLWSPFKATCDRCGGTGILSA